MLSTKESMFLKAVKEMFNEQPKSSALLIPNTTYLLGKDLEGRVFFLKKTEGEVFLCNPVKWVSGVCEEIGVGTFGMPELTEIDEDSPLSITSKTDFNSYHSLAEGETIVEILEVFNGSTDAEFDESRKGIVSSLEIHAELASGTVTQTSQMVFLEDLIEEEPSDEEWDEEEDFEDSEDSEKVFKITGTDVEITWDKHKTGETETISTNGSIGVSKIEDEDFVKAIEKLLENEDDGQVHVQERSDHQTIASDIADLVDEKQKAYGDSVGKSERIMEILLEGYDNGDGTYTIPKALLAHLLYQIRIIDKQNRVFSNPEQDLMDESPYADILGYALLMLAKQKKEKE